MTSPWGSHDREADEERFTVSVQAGTVALARSPETCTDYAAALEAVRADATEASEYVYRVFPGESY